MGWFFPFCAIKIVARFCALFSSFLWYWLTNSFISVEIPFKFFPVQFIMVHQKLLLLILFVVTWRKTYLWLLHSFVHSFHKLETESFSLWYQWVHYSGPIVMNQLSIFTIKILYLQKHIRDQTIMSFKLSKKKITGKYWKRLRRGYIYLMNHWFKKTNSNST